MPNTTTAAQESSPLGSSKVKKELTPQIGLLGAVAIGVGTMVAAGIFVLSGLAVNTVGAAAIVSFLLAAVVASFTAAAYAEFSTLYQESGGGYMYVAKVFDSELTYFVGWAMMLGYPAAAAFFLASFSDWFYRFMYPVLGLSQAVPYWGAGLVVLVCLVVLNVRGTKGSRVFQVLVTLLKVGLVLLFLYGGLQTFNSEAVMISFQQNIGNLAEIGLTSVLVFITFFGFEAIAANAEEIKRSERTVPRAIAISMVVVVVTFALTVLTIVLAVNNSEFFAFLANSISLNGLSPEVFVAQNGEVAMGLAAQYYLGPTGFYAIVVGALLSMLAAANVTLMAGSRVKLAMARHKHLPKGFGGIHSSFGTPYRAVLLTGGLIFLFIITFTVFPNAAQGGAGRPVLGIEALAYFATFMLLTGFIFVNVAVLESRWQNPNLERLFQVPGAPWVPILTALANLALLMYLEKTSLLLGLGGLAAGILFWFVWKKRLPVAEGPKIETPTAVAEYAYPITPKGRYQVVVPIANPANVVQLMQTAVTLAKERNGELLIVSVVTMPDQTPLSKGHQQVQHKRPIVQRARLFADEAGVPVHGIVQIAHHPGDAILNAIAEHNSDAVLLGWRGHGTSRRNVIMGTTVDKVVTEATCDVFVEKVGVQITRRAKSILLPISGGPHTSLAVDTAVAIARVTGATIYAVHVVPPDASEAVHQQGEQLMKGIKDQLKGVAVEAALVEGKKVAQTIVREASNHNLVVIGANGGGLLQQLLFGTVPKTVAEQTQQTVIMVKRPLPVTSLLKESLQRLWR